MNTNDQQFLKAYNELVAAFFNFMNVVSPQNNQQLNLSYIASQLNQLLKYLGQIPQEPISAQNTMEVPEANPNMATTVLSPSVVTNPSPATSPIQPTVQNPPSNDELLNPVVKYCAYPELTNGQYKFKSSALKDMDGNESDEERENFIYKLTIDESLMRGYVELVNLTSDQVKIITNNPTQYTPQDVCIGANNITPGKMSITSQSKLHLVKVVRGWVIAEGEKFVLNVQ